MNYLLQGQNPIANRWLALLLVGILPWHAPRQSAAAPLDFARVAADADWLVHIDFDALHQSTVFQKARAKALAHWTSLATRLEKANQQYGMNLATDLHGMTVCGPRLSAQKSVLVMQADWAADAFDQRMALAPGHTVVANGPHEIHRFTRNDHGQARPLAGAIWRKGTFVFGQSADEIKLGLAVLNGQQPSLAGGKSPLAADVPPGTILVARMIGVGDALPIESPLLKQANRISFACGEADGQWFIRGSLLAKSPEAALQAKGVAEGLIAMARLRDAADTDSLKLLDRIQIRVDDRTVEVDFRAAADEVARHIEKVIDKY